MSLLGERVRIDVGDGSVVAVLPANTAPAPASPVVTPTAAVTTPPAEPVARAAPLPASFETDALIPRGVTLPTGRLGENVTVTSLATPLPPSTAATNANPPMPATPAPPLIGSSQAATQPLPASPGPLPDFDTDALVPIGVHLPRGFLGQNVTLVDAPPVVVEPRRTPPAAMDPTDREPPAPPVSGEAGRMGPAVRLPALHAPGDSTGRAHPASTSPTGRRPVSQLVISPRGYAAIAHFEGFRPRAYNDKATQSDPNPPDGNATIGYGHLLHKGPLTAADRAIPPMTKREALQLLRKQAAQFAAAVRQQVKVPLTQNEFDALVDFTYNEGVRGLAESQALVDLNAGRYGRVGADFSHYDRGNIGLQNRHAAQRAMFNEGKYPKGP